MSFAQHLSRLPIPDPAVAPDALCDPLRALGGDIQALLAGAATNSPYLAGLMQREGAWLAEAMQQDPDTAFGALMAEQTPASAQDLRPRLRQAKARVALFTALADLGGVWTLEQVTGALSRFADRAVDLGLKALIAPEIARGKLPGLGEDAIETAGGMAVLAMGKHGAFELNYSSDIDLICLFDESRFDPSDYHDARAVFIRVTRRLMGLLSDHTGDGYVFRTDLRLRPDANATPVCLAMETAERYYESVGRTWERAAYVKARPCAGDLAAGAAFLRRLTPFVWRRHLDFAAIQDAHDMRLRIRDHKGLHGPIRLEGHDMKLGAGGIREIEFFTQTRQIIAGGRDPDLRVRATVEGLARLSDKGWVPAPQARALQDAYRAHRDIEHRIQMVSDAQTHRLPSNPEGIARIARLSAAPDVARFRDELGARLHRVAHLTEAFFAPRLAAPDGGTGPETGADGVAPAPKDGVALSAAAAAIVDRWPSYPAFRSSRALDLFRGIRPKILTRLTGAADPDRAIMAFDGFLAGLPAGVQILSLFDANPQLLDLLIETVTIAPELGQYLSRNSAVLDGVIGGDFFSPWAGRAALEAELSARLEQESDYERKLDAARRWSKEWHFRISVHLLRGLINADSAGRQFAELAEAVIAALWPVVAAQFAQKHGGFPGKGAAVIGMGSLGAGQFTARSDLDLIVIYDPGRVETSDGARPLPVRSYYARFTQALITALTAPMAEGKLYDVDMRLRPSGNQGPVATSFPSFRLYQREEAWTWEHLALTRARVVTGTPGLCAAVESLRRVLISDKSDRATILAAVADMRARLAEAKPLRGAFDTKQGAGRGQDIELIAAAAALAASEPGTRFGAHIDAGLSIGLFAPDQADTLGRAYRLFRRVDQAAKLLQDGPLDLDSAGPETRRFVLRSAGFEHADALRAAMRDAAARADAVISALVS